MAKIAEKATRIMLVYSIGYRKEFVSLYFRECFHAGIKEVHSITGTKNQCRDHSVRIED